MNRRKYIIAGLLAVIAAAGIIFYAQETDIYAHAENWAYFGGEELSADLFLICPTVDTRDEYNMKLDDEKTRRNFLGALNMERGIYEDYTRMYAPYYRQASLKVYDLNEPEREKYLAFAYKDISSAFAYYLKHENKGRPIILAGFSQGADMCYRLLKEYFADEKLSSRLVAVYAIGWPCMTEEKYPQIKPAQSESDTGVVISFECESPRVTSTVIYPAGRKAHSINPLNWSTDDTSADKSLNLGACFTDYSGAVRKEVAQFCGGYIDLERGTVKITDINEAEYPAYISFLPEGAYHIYDYQFFFRNLQQNVKTRIKAYHDLL